MAEFSEENGGTQPPTTEQPGSRVEAEAPPTPRARLEHFLGGEKLGSPKAWIAVEQAELARTNARVWSLGQKTNPSAIEIAQATADYSNAKANDRKGRFGENSTEYNTAADTFNTYVLDHYRAQAGKDHPNQTDGFEYTIMAADAIDDDLLEITRGIPAETTAPVSPTTVAEVADAAATPEPEETGRDFFKVKDGLLGISSYDMTQAVQEGDYITTPWKKFKSWASTQPEDKSSIPESGITKVKVVEAQRGAQGNIEKLVVEAGGHRKTIYPSLFTGTVRPTEDELQAATTAGPAEIPAPGVRAEGSEPEDPGRNFLEATKDLQWASERKNAVREGDYIDMPWEGDNGFSMWFDAKIRSDLPQSGTARVKVVGIERYPGTNSVKELIVEASGYRTKKDVSLFSNYGGGTHVH